MDNTEFQARTEQIDQLVQRVTALEDENARAATLDLLQSLMDLHGAVLGRVVEMLAESGDPGRALLAKLGTDPLICGLLVLYGVHPVKLEERVRTAIEKAQTRLKKQGGTVELAGIIDTTVRVKIESSSGHGCKSSVDALKRTVDQAILEVAPEVIEIVVEGAAPSASGFVPLSMIQPLRGEEREYEKSTA